MAKIILTGDRPTGRLHVGHYVGSLRRRVELQNSGEYDKIFIMIADAQELTDNFENPEKVRQNIIEVALDYLSCGLDPTKSTLFIQSQISELCELTFYYMDLVTVSRLQRNPTVKSEIKMRDFETSIPVGFFSYPISQAADITAFKATTVPVGEDQLPMIEQTREIVRKFNGIYDEVLVEPEVLLPDNAACMRLPGIDGKQKMSKSLGNCIYLSDTEEDVRAKIMEMYTDPLHIKVSDPGHIEGNTVFTYLDAFSRPEHFEEYMPDYANLDELKEHYRKGGLGDVKIKRFLNNVMQEELSPIRARRAEFEKDIPEVYNILKKGSDVARETAAQTLSEVKRAMKIDYFEDQDLIRYHKELIRVRKENPACRRGSGIPVYAKDGHFAFGRFLDDNHVLTIINNTEEAERMTIPVWQIEISDGELFERQVLSMEEEFNLEKAHYLVCDGKIEIYMPPYSAAVMSHTGNN